MSRQLIIDLSPLAIALLLALGGLATLVRLLSPKEIRNSVFRLHGDQAGSVQSLGFVLTVPVFIMLMLFVVQVTQLMVGMIGVQYSAFAAARSASVWIPARYGDEPENCIGTRTGDRQFHDGQQFLIAPGGQKYERIRSAAVLACVPVAPSRDLKATNQQSRLPEALIRVYAAVAPSSQSNSRMPRRLANKWAYADANTQIEIRIFHPKDEPPLQGHHPHHMFLNNNFAANEIGNRDLITVTVTHRFALLPGPGRLLARRVGSSSSSDATSQAIGRTNSVYFVPLTASARLGNEGEKSLVPYVQSSL